jgi:O-antigen/teichoic acid export membrane protein
MNHLTFSLPERVLAYLAGVLNLVVGLAFFLLPELQPYLPFPLWPTPISPVLTRFIGAIVLGNSIGAFWLSTQREWARVRALALVAVVYGTLVATALLYHLLWLHASPFFWFYFGFDVPFLIVYYALFIYHDIAPRMHKSGSQVMRH